MSRPKSPILELICPECGPLESVFAEPGQKCPSHDRYYVVAEALEHRDGRLFVGKVIGGQYLIFDRIGQGGMGSVYKAVHLKLMRIVAVKMIRSQESGLSEMERLVERFKFEAQSLSRLSHRNIVTVYDYGETSGLLYLVLEYVDGRPLTSIIREHKTISIKQAVDWTNQLLDALSEIHSIGLLHRDIKPSNLMIEERGHTSRLVLIDFGVAKGRNKITGDFSRELTRTGTAVGTPLYMSPEALRALKLGPWSDLYAVGVLIFHMLAGKTPFTGSSADIISAHLSKPVPALPNMPELKHISKVIAKAMAKAPKDRFESALALKNDLREAMELDFVVNPRIETQALNVIRSNAKTQPSTSDASLSDEASASSRPAVGSKREENTNSAPTDLSQPELSMPVTEPSNVNEWSRFKNEEPLDSERASPYSSARRSALGIAAILLLSMATIFMLNPKLFEILGGNLNYSLNPQAQSQSPHRMQTDDMGIDTESKQTSLAVSPPVAQVLEPADNHSQLITTKMTGRDSIMTKKPPSSKIARIEAQNEPVQRTDVNRAPRGGEIARRRPAKGYGINGSHLEKELRGVSTKSSKAALAAHGETWLKIPTAQDFEGDAALLHDPLAVLPRKVEDLLSAQLQICDCRRARVTINSMRQKMAPNKWRAANERYQESCGVIGKGCRR